MVIPPSGTARGEFEEKIAGAEREFLRRGITLISPAITGRVVLSGKEEAGRHTTVASLSDMERALILAKESSADALLQIGTLQWEPSENSGNAWRFFVKDKGAEGYRFLFFVPIYRFREVSREVFINTSSEERFSLEGDFLNFTGRLVGTQTGEVLASFWINGWRVQCLPQPYEAELEFEPGGGGWRIVNSNYVWRNGEWIREARIRIVESVFSTVADVITGTEPKSQL